MTLGIFDLSTFYFWTSLFGIFFGGSLSFAIAPLKKRSATAFLIFISIAILMGLVVLIITDFKLKIDAFQLVWLAGSIIFGYFSTFFWKIIGLPIVIVMILFSGFVFYSLSDWNFAKINKSVVDFSIISIDENSLTIQTFNANNNTNRQEISSKTVKPDIKIIQISEYFFFLPKRTFYFFNGFFQLEDSPKQELSYGKLLSLMLEIPGFSYRQADAEILHPSESVNYTYYFDENYKAIVSRKNFMNF